MAEWFALSVSPLELFVRGTAMYWFLLLLFRFVTRRDIGAVGLNDVLLLVLIADAAQNGMSGDYRSITDGVILVSTIVGWNLLVDWATYRFAGLRRLLEPAPLALVVAGKVQRRNLRRELISIEELNAKLREQGVEDLAQVKLACMESDGSISVIRFEPDRAGPGAAGAPAQRHLGG